MAKTTTVLAPLPRTRARTPIGILKAVAKAIREEPLRYNQHDWGQTLVGLSEKAIVAERSDEGYGQWGSRTPACGTVACVAGWVCVIANAPVITRGTSVCGRRAFNGAKTARRAQRLLKLTYLQAEHLFYAGALEDALDPDEDMPERGTPAYAELGVKHIEQFMRKELGYRGPAL